MDTLSASEAAALLHIHVKRVQGLARAGKLPAVRVGRKWLFPRSRLEALLGAAPEGLGHGSAGNTRIPAALDLSARNQLRGRVAAVEIDGVMAEVRLRIGDQELVAIITKGSAERLNLRPGDEVLAVIKSTEVMIGRGAP